MPSQQPEFTNEDVQLLQSESLYQGFYRLRQFTLQHRLFAGGDSKPLQRECLIRPAAAAVLLYDPVADEVALVEQFRIGAMANQDAQPWLLELVAGLLDREQEQPAAVARREAEEEAGCVISALEPVARYYSSPGGSSEYLHLYCGRVDLRQQRGGIFGLASENEDIRLHVMPFTEAILLMQQGHIRTAHTLIALQWLQLQHRELRQRWLANNPEVQD